MENMTGIELIANERTEQIEKHGYSTLGDVHLNENKQLSLAAMYLLSGTGGKNVGFIPNGWDVNLWRKMQSKSYEERLIIAGALIAAELDRLNETPHNTNK